LAQESATGLAPVKGSAALVMALRWAGQQAGKVVVPETMTRLDCWLVTKRWESFRPELG